MAEPVAETESGRAPHGHRVLEATWGASRTGLRAQLGWDEPQGTGSLVTVPQKVLVERQAPLREASLWGSHEVGRS